MGPRVITSLYAIMGYKGFMGALYFQIAGETCIRALPAVTFLNEHYLSGTPGVGW